MRRVPLIMGIVNVTPDSFSDGGRFLDPPEAVLHALSLVKQGADILDIGGESTRPGCDPVSSDEEWARVGPVLESLLPKVSVPVSIDTRKAEVAEKALSMGCHMVNDVTACSDEGMPEVVRTYGALVVVMHMLGEPKTMQISPCYEDVVKEVRDFLLARAHRLEKIGVPKESIIIDPGIGFGKRFRDNLDLLNNLSSFKDTGFPLLVGASRKRFIGELLDTDTNGRLFGSLGAAARCYLEGVDIVRVHDVGPTRELFEVLDATFHPGDYQADW